ncbi:MAG: J domain-containing protein [Lentisphaeria bacterium]|nr:J domain-containing protein [Lentisphaeria bacterium]
MNYYEILGIERECEFAALKKAYYRRARECHPDRFGNAPEKAEEFKTLVEAFVTLSDPEKRRQYDAALFSAPAYTIIPEREIIMDSEADDTLEELIVGNDPPRNTTLFTFFRDLEKTYVFMTCREARNMFEKRKFRTAAKMYERLVSLAPGNILYRVYLARCQSHLGHLRKAALHYRAALTIGRHRDPPQHLIRIQDELRKLNRRRLPLWERFLDLFREKSQPELLSPEEEMIAAAEREMSRLLIAEKKKIEQKNRKLLDTSTERK